MDTVATSTASIPNKDVFYPRAADFTATHRKKKVRHELALPSKPSAGADSLPSADLTTAPSCDAIKDPPLVEPVVLHGELSSEDADNEDSSVSSTDESTTDCPELIVASRPRNEDDKLQCARLQVRCWYLPLKFGGVPVRFLVDSGSEVTIVCTEVFRGNDVLRSLPLDKTSWRLSGIGGAEVAVHGVTILPIKLGDQEYQVEAIVADITTPGVLGMNFFEQHNISTNYNRGELVLDGETHFLEHLKDSRSFRVKVAHATVVPPYSEKVVCTTPVRTARALVSGYTFCVAPANSFASYTGLAMGGTLVRSNHTVSQC